MKIEFEIKGLSILKMDRPTEEAIENMLNPKAGKEKKREIDLNREAENKLYKTAVFML